MRVRLWLGEEDPTEIDLLANEVWAFSRTLGKIRIVDENGHLLKFLELTYDAGENAFDLTFIEEGDE